jgi:putative ABC transport system permease protein
MRSDLRYAWRAIWKSPATSVGAMLALALGIGATTTIFGLLNVVLLRPLPYPEADRLVEIWGTVQREQVERRGTSLPDYFDWRAEARSFEAMSAWLSTTFIVYGADEPVLANAEVVDGPYFELLGARPLDGRVFQSDDHKPGAAAVAVIGEKLWEQRFSRSRDAIGRSIQLDSRIYTIVGIVPASFAGRSDTAEVWTTIAATIPPAQMKARGNRGFAPIARLAPGVTLAAAQAEITAVCAQLEKAYPATNEKRYAQVSPLATEIFQQVRPAVSLLFGVVALVLMIACANVASLLLSRGEARRREMALRRALGAEDRQLVRLLIAESAILVMFGGGLGWLLAQWTGDALLALSPVQLPSFAAPATDWRTVAFVATIAILTTVTIGLTPLGSLGGESLAQTLREGAVAARGAGRVSALRFIVVGEVALAVALLVGASLLARSFSALLHFDPGFTAAGVLTLRAQYPLPPSAPAGATAGAFAQTPAPPPGVSTLAVLDELRALPGVRSASLTTAIPLVDAGAIFYSAEGMPPADATNRPRSYVQRVSTRHFETLGMPLVEGRDFTANELARGNTSVIVSEKVATRFWPGQSALGRRIRQGDATSSTPWLTIIGVVGEANLRGIPRNPTADPDLYLPFAETTRVFAVVIRTDGDPASLASPAREALRRINPGVAVFDVQPLSELVDTQLASAKFLSWVTGAFAVVALTLALIGIYGTLAYWVRRRTAEIGIRTALGADRSRVLRLVVGQAMTLTAIGVVTGAILAAALGRFVQTQLYGVQPIDWVSFTGTAAVMVLAALIASLAPAMRALRIDPMLALRADA